MLEGEVRCRGEGARAVAVGGELLIHRPGRRTNAAGLMIVMYRPPSAGRITVSKPMSWNIGNQVTPREFRSISMVS